VGTFTVLNGASGVTEALAEMIQQAGVLANVARQTMAPMIAAQNGEGSGSNSEHPGRQEQPAVVPSGSKSRKGPGRPGGSSDGNPTASSINETGAQQAK
jgi:hypothetical protein